MAETQGGRSLVVDAVTHRYPNGALAVENINLDIKGGEIIALLGPSGCGKTTLLRIIAGFIAQTQGRIIIGDDIVDALPPNRRAVGIVFQNYALFPHLSISENVAYGLAARGIDKATRQREAQRLLELVQLPTMSERLPRQLSGGQQQRVALARALAIKPSILLLDEPFAALDKNLRLDMQIEVKRLQRVSGITTLIVTHDQEEALSMADRVAVFNDGRIMQVGTPEEIYQRPASRFVADFVGSSNVLPPDFVQRHSGQHRWGSLRPEQIRVLRQASGDGVAARVLSRHYLGAATKLALDADGLRLHASLPAGASVPDDGEHVVLAFSRDQLHLMEEQA